MLRIEEISNPERQVLDNIKAPNTNALKHYRVVASSDLSGRSNLVEMYEIATLRSQ
jgi:hypothetical protein